MPINPPDVTKLSLWCKIVHCNNNTAGFAPNTAWRSDPLAGCIMENFLLILDDDLLTAAQALADLISSWIF
jgi:hypothetical protein